MRIGLFGGTFNPVHNGHIEIALKAMRHFALDKVIFIPSGAPPHKCGEIADKIHRYNMVKLAVEGIDGFEVSDYETKKEGKTYSIDTLLYFKAKYPSDELYFIIGDDAYAEIDTWRDSDRVRAMCRFIVVTRTGEKPNPPAERLEIEPIEISSTEIRRKVKVHEDIRDYVPEKVYEYIRRNILW